MDKQASKQTNIRVDLMTRLSRVKNANSSGPPLVPEGRPKNIVSIRKRYHASIFWLKLK